jgi:hypothetical protein
MAQFTTTVNIAYSDAEVTEVFKASDRKASTRVARRFIRNQGLSIKDAEKEEKTKNHLIVNLTVDAEAPVAEEAEEEAES